MGAVFGDEGPAMILGLQPAAMLDHIARVHDSILDRIPGERNGSQQVFVIIISKQSKYIHFERRYSKRFLKSDEFTEKISEKRF